MTDTNQPAGPQEGTRPGRDGVMRALMRLTGPQRMVRVTLDPVDVPVPDA